MASSPFMNRVRTRAMHRATRELRNRYPAEYAELYQAAFKVAHAEALADIAKVAREHPNEPPPPDPKNSFRRAPDSRNAVPPRLVTGTRPEGAPRLRDDVARCPYCQRYHDRGHECASCRHKPPGAPAGLSPYMRVGS